jgi:hypothetical protein
MRMETNDYDMRKRCCGHGFWRCFGFGVLGILGFAALVILAGFVVMWLWNWLMPSIFHLGTITYWQAVGLAVLGRLLLGGCGHGHMRGMHKWHHQSKSDCCGHHSENFRGKDHSDCECDTHKWKLYDEYWKEEGEKAYDEYVKRKGENA